MDDRSPETPPTPRSPATWIIGIFAAALLVLIVVTSWQYFSHARDPDNATGAGQVTGEPAQRN